MTSQSGGARGGQAAAPSAPVRSIRRYQRTERANLPAPYAAEWAVFYLNPSVEESDAMQGTDNLTRLASLIRSWSLLDDDDQPLPISAASLRLIGLDLVIALDTAYGELHKSPLAAPTAGSSPPTAPVTETPASPTGTSSA